MRLDILIRCINLNKELWNILKFSKVPEVLWMSLKSLKMSQDKTYNSITCNRKNTYCLLV